MSRNHEGQPDWDIWDDRLIVALALKGAALFPLDPLSAVCVFIAAHAGARLAAVLTIWALSYAGDGSAKVSRPASELTLPELTTAIDAPVAAPGSCRVLERHVFSTYLRAERAQSRR